LCGDSSAEGRRQLAARPPAGAHHGRYRQKLEHEQLLLARFVDVGVDIFAMTATFSLAAQRSTDSGAPGQGPSSSPISAAGSLALA